MPKFIAKLLTMLFVCVALSIEPAAARTLRVAIAGDLNQLDPHALNETLTIGLLGNAMEGLTRRDKDLNIVPGLATRWETLSPTHWRIYLRRGIVFHDGSPFTADDVLFSIARARGRFSQMKHRVPSDARFVRIDSHTIDVLLGKPDPIMHHDWDNLFIMSKTWAEKNGLAQVHAPTVRVRPRGALQANGTGPYRIVSHQPGRQTVFERNSRWWGWKAGQNVDRVVVETVASPTTRTAALLGGQVDVIVPAPLRELGRIKRSRHAHAVVGSELRTLFLNLDSFRQELRYANVKGQNPFKDPRVRRAIYQAIDIDAIRDNLMEGLSHPSALLISPSLFKLSGRFKRLPYDLAAARDLMRKAGYAKGFAVALDCPNNRYMRDEAICVAISHMLARIGIQVTVRAVPKARFFQRITAASGYDSSMSLLGWTPGTMDGLDILTNLAGCRDAAGHGGLFNMGGYCNREVDRLAARIRAETDLGTRDELLAKAFRIIHDEAGLIPLQQQPQAWGVSNALDMTLRRDNQIHFDLTRWRTPERRAGLR